MSQDFHELAALEAMAKAMPDREKAERLHRSKTLVLNADYQPISVLPLHTVNWKVAVTLVYQDKCKVIESYEDLLINSAKCSYRVPSILVNAEYVRPKRKVEFSRTNVFLRDNYQCQYCGDYHPAQGLTFDHYVPRAEGGKTTWTNIVSACKRCNHKKATQNRNRWKARTVPYRPAFSELEAKARKRQIVVQDPRWIKYLNWEGPIHVNDGINAYDVAEDSEYYNF